MSKELRPYQIDSHNAVINRLAKGINSQLVVLPTGAGKTFTAVKLIEKLGYKRGLWITDREELISQSALAFIRNKFDDEFANMVEDQGYVDYVRNGGLFALNDFKMGLIKADVFEPSGNVVMASAQTLHRRLDKFKPDEFDFVVCDEAHLFMSPTLVKSVTYFTPKLLLGLTATAYRADGLPLGNIFDEMVYEYQLRDAIRDGYLCELDAIKIKTTVSLDGVKTLGGEFNQKELSNEVNTLARNNLVADSYLKYGKGRQGIFFAVDIKHAMDLNEAFLQKGVRSTAVSSNEELTGDRSQKIKDFKAGKYDVLLNVSILTTGFDFPDTGIIGCAAPTKSKTKYVQCVGRGTRLKSKEYVAKFGQNCIILDFTDNTTRHNLVNAHELDKELDPENRVFISEEKRQMLIDARAERMGRIAKITHTQEKDEKISLFKIPKIKINKSIRMREPATQKQLDIIKTWGYPTDTVDYTKGMVNEIFASQPISDKQKWFFAQNGYDVKDKEISKAQAAIMSREIDERKSKKPTVF